MTAVDETMNGNLFTTASYLRDTSDMYGFFFIFPDLSIRSSGTFRLKFKLFDTKLLRLIEFRVENGMSVAAVDIDPGSSRPGTSKSPNRLYPGS